MVGTGSSNSRLVNWDNRAIGVSNEAVESSSIDGRGSSSSVDTSNNSLGGQMIGTSGGDSGLINGDNSAVRVSDQLCVEVEGASIAVVDRGNGGNGWSSGIGDRGNGGGCGVAEGRGIGVGLSLDSKMISTGGGNSGLINRDNSAIGVSNQLCVEVEGASIAVVDGGNGGNGGSSGVGDRGDSGGSGVAEGRSIGVGLSLDSQMISTGSGDSGLINGDNSAIGVSDQLCVKVEGAGIAVGGSVARVASIGNRGGIVAGVCNSRGSSNWGSGIASISNSRGSSIASISNSGGSSIASIANSGGSSIANWGNSSLERQMVSTGSSHGGLINGDNSAIGEGLESIEALGGGGGNTSGENQKLHD